MKDRRQLTPAAALVESQGNALDRFLKAQNPDFDYSNLNIECCYFYQQFKDHFETTRAKGHKYESFAVTFLKDYILNCWQ